MTDLPIKQVLAQIDAALAGAAYAETEKSEKDSAAAVSSEKHGQRGDLQPRAVLIAPPGAGKSTFLPLHLLSAPWSCQGRIILLEPRRLAARAVAFYMAEQLGEKVGQTVGYAMRMDKNYSAATRILVMTEGSFTRLILDNPELDGVCAVLFDEFHERSLEADFGLALTLDVADSLRPDLRILVMSATIDGAGVAALLEPEGKKAPIIVAEGRNFPVELRYRPRKSGMRAAGSRSESIEEAVAKTCMSLLPTMETGSFLVFLPGQAEIRRVRALLEEKLGAAAGDGVLIAPLYGGLSQAEQENAVKPAPSGCRKIVLATSIAESALTIADVRIVIDSGLARLPVFDRASGITRLQTRRVSQASAAQRAGRAGRVQAGIAVRLWHEEQNKALPAYAPPEILTADISNLLLDCADFGIAELRDLRFLDRPSETSCRQARQNLSECGALDDSGRITQRGRALRQLNLPLNLAHMLLLAAAGGKKQAEQAARLAILLTEQSLGGGVQDLDKRLENFARDNGAYALRAKKAAKNLADKAMRLSEKSGDTGNKSREETRSEQARKKLLRKSFPQERQSLGVKISAGILLARAWSLRVARRRDENASSDSAGQYLLASGRGCFLAKDSSLFGKTWLVCAELSGQGTNARIRSAAEIPQDFLPHYLQEQAKTVTHTVFDEESAALRSFKQRCLGAIVLENASLPPPQGEEANQGWLQAVRAFGLQILPWGEKSCAERARLGFLHAHSGAPWPDVSDAALTEGLQIWLLPFLRGQARFSRSDSDILYNALRALLSYDLQKQADTLAPLYFTAPSGNRIAVRYQEKNAVIAVRAQELFGLRQHPFLLGGKAPLQLELLSPAGRILQITADIAGFWKGSWQDVAAEMRGRYPKHFWPQNPESAAPARKKMRARQ